MKKLKRIILMLTITVSSLKVSAQDYYHGFGGSINYLIYHVVYSSPTVSVDESGAIAVGGIFYKATLGLSDRFGISAYPFLGLSFSANSRSGGSGSFGIGLPIAAEIYAGDMDDACFIAGAGFSYTYMASSYSGSGSVLGPMLQLGGQFNMRDKLVGVRVSYTFGLNEAKFDDSSITVTKDTKSMLSLGIYYPLGQ